MARKLLTDADVRTIHEAIVAHGGVKRAYQALRGKGYTWNTVVEVSKTRPERQPNHAKPEFGELPAALVDPVAVLESAATRVKAKVHDPDYRRITVAADGPIAVMKASDLHFGGLDVDYQALLDHVRFLMDTPGFYLQLFGDDLNLMVMHKTAGARHDGWTPEEQVQWLESFVHMALERGKLISMASGNHSDEFTERHAGFGIVRALMKHKVPYFRGFGYIDLAVGKVTYPMAFVHKTRFHSFMNALHGNKRMMQQHHEFFGAGRPIAREYITAHTHFPEYKAEGCTPEDRVWLIKCGTYKTNCLYSQRYFGQGRIGVPTVVYRHDRVDHVCFPTPYDAACYMRGLGVGGESAN